jgi:hypothetical protein
VIAVAPSADPETAYVTLVGVAAVTKETPDHAAGPDDRLTQTARPTVNVRSGEAHVSVTSVVVDDPDVGMIEGPVSASIETFSVTTLAVELPLKAVSELRKVDAVAEKELFTSVVNV